MRPISNLHKITIIKNATLWGRYLIHLSNVFPTLARLGNVAPIDESMVLRITTNPDYLRWHAALTPTEESAIRGIFDNLNGDSISNTNSLINSAKDANISGNVREYLELKASRSGISTDDAFTLYHKFGELLKKSGDNPDPTNFDELKNFILTNKENLSKTTNFIKSAGNTADSGYIILKKAIEEADVARITGGSPRAGLPSSSPPSSSSSSTVKNLANSIINNPKTWLSILTTMTVLTGVSAIGAVGFYYFTRNERQGYIEETNKFSDHLREFSDESVNKNTNEGRELAEAIDQLEDEQNKLNQIIALGQTATPEMKEQALESQKKIYGQGGLQQKVVEKIGAVINNPSALKPDANPREVEEQLLNISNSSNEINGIVAKGIANQSNNGSAAVGIPGIPGNTNFPGFQNTQGWEQAIRDTAGAAGTAARSLVGGAWSGVFPDDQNQGINQSGGQAYIQQGQPYRAQQSQAIGSSIPANVTLSNGLTYSVAISSRKPQIPPRFIMYLANGAGPNNLFRSPQFTAFVDPNPASPLAGMGLVPNAVGKMPFDQRIESAIKYCYNNDIDSAEELEQFLKNQITSGQGKLQKLFTNEPEEEVLDRAFDFYKGSGSQAVSEERKRRRRLFNRPDVLKISSRNFSQKNQHSINKHSSTMNKLAETNKQKVTVYEDAVKGLEDKLTKSYYAGLNSMYNEKPSAPETDLKSLYGLNRQNSVEMIQSAHPKSVYLSESMGDGALIENTLEQQAKTEQILFSGPTGNFQSKHAFFGYLDKLAKYAKDSEKAEAYELIKSTINKLENN